MATAAPPSIPAKTGNDKWRGVLLSGSAGIGVALTYAAIELMRSEPKAFADLVIRTITNWGPLFILCLLLLYVLNNWGQKFVEHAARNAMAQQQAADAMQQNAVAQQQMAAAMQQIASKDDERERERELAFDHLAFTAQSILGKVEGIEKQCSAMCGARNKDIAHAAAGGQA